MQQLRDLADHLGSEIAADDVAAERQRQAAGPPGPPLPEIDDLLQPFVLVRQLPLVDQQPRVRLAIENCLTDFVERDDEVFEVRLVDAQGQVGGGERARDSDPRALYLRRTILARHHDRTVLVAHARAVRQQRVLVDEMRIGVKGHRRHLVAPLERRPVQRLDVREHLVDDDAAGVDVVARQTIEHERVVGIRAVRDSDANLSHWVNRTPATSYQLPATSYQLPATSYQLPATSCQLPAPLRLRVGSQRLAPRTWKKRRSRIPQNSAKPN